MEMLHTWLTIPVPFLAIQGIGTLTPTTRQAITCTKDDPVFQGICSFSCTKNSGSIFIRAFCLENKAVPIVRKVIDALKCHCVMISYFISPACENVLDELRPEQNGTHFIDILTAFSWMKISVLRRKFDQRCYSWGLVDKNTALVQVMFWCLFSYVFVRLHWLHLSRLFVPPSILLSAAIWSTSSQDARPYIGLMLILSFDV